MPSISVAEVTNRSLVLLRFDARDCTSARMEARLQCVDIALLGPSVRTAWTLRNKDPYDTITRDSPPFRRL